METKGQILRTIDTTVKKLKFNGVRALVAIAQDVIDKINGSIKATSEDFELLKEYTDIMDGLLFQFLQLQNLQNTPLFTASEEEITAVLTMKTDKELKEFRESYEKVTLKTDMLLKQINSRN